MPRVAIKKKEYMLSDFSEWIVGRMKKLGHTQKSMGELIGISQPAFRAKLENNKFSFEDAITIMKALSATDEEILRLVKL